MKIDIIENEKNILQCVFCNFKKLHKISFHIYNEIYRLRLCENHFNELLNVME